MEGTEQLHCIVVVNKDYLISLYTDLKDKHIYISQWVSKVS